MNKKTLKVLLAAILVIISAFSFNFVVLAEPGDDSDFVITEVPSDGEDIDATEEETEVETTEKPTKKPTTTRKPTTTKNQTPVWNNTQTEETEETDDFDFKIKLELNNGEEAIEAEVNDGIVEIPEAPKKEGFKFDGWYADSELTEKWDFLTSKADEDTVLYAKWEELPDDSLYTISVSTNLGGTITVKPTKAKAGETVTITVKTDEGKKLVENSLSVNGKFIEDYTFEMPANNVIVEAQFESVDADVIDADKNAFKDNIGKFVTIGALALVVIAIVIWLIVNRYRFLPEEEEDELFFVEPMTNQPAIRHDDFVRNKLNQMNAQGKSDDIDIMNEAEIRKINKTGNINLDQ